LSGDRIVVSAAGRLPECTPVLERIHRLQPAPVGGCRPIKIHGLLAADHWELRYRRVISTYAIASEVLMALCRPPVPDVS
jgi:hypothetical protein